MNHTGYVRSACFILLFLITAPLSVYPFSDQITSERILRENKHFVHFLDICITNFAENKTEKFRKAYEIHFNADVSFLQADYKRTYKKVYASQEVLTGLYSEMVKDYYLEESKNILDKLAPVVIRSKNARARLFLTLGYRDRTISWTHYTMSEASNPRLYSYKIYKFKKAIQYSRRAKRYAFLALLESQNNETKKKIYLHLLKSENKSGNLFFNRFSTLSEADYIKEMGKNYDEFEKDLNEKKGAVSDKTATDKTDADKSDSGKANTGKEGPSFEKKVEKRVRFRSEKRAARYLIDAEFDQAEDIFRKNISDFNFKIVTSAFEVLSGAEAGSMDSVKIDYNSFKIHLLDNYSRLTKSSILESFYGKVSVEDKVDEEKAEMKEGQVDEHAIKEEKAPEKRSEIKEQKETAKQAESREQKGVK